MRIKPTNEQLIDREIRLSDRALRRRRRLDSFFRVIRSCAVCTSALPPIDLLCPVCWRELGRVMNRGRDLRQKDFVFPTYSLLTWTPQTERFVRPLIYGFKGGYSVRAAEKLAVLFLSERSLGDAKFSEAFLVSAPSSKFDHSQLWASALAQGLKTQAWPLLQDKLAAEASQKGLRQAERGNRRHLVKEHFAKSADEARGAKRILFADDVVTTGSTAMAAYMALGDPVQFEVWTLVARPRLATKSGA